MRAETGVREDLVKALGMLEEANQKMAEVIDMLFLKLAQHIEADELADVAGRIGEAAELARKMEA